MGGVEHASPAIAAFLILVLWVLLRSIQRATRATAPLYIRRIAGVDAIERCIGRAVEAGRPLLFSAGLTGLGPVLYACLGVLATVARKAALFRSRLLVPQAAPDAIALTEEVVMEAYRTEHRSASFENASLMFLSEEQFAFASGYIGMVHRERPAAIFLMGTFAAESLILAEAGQYVGATQVAASVSPEQVAFFVCTCDYTLIGEELFSASAYLSRDPVLLGSLYGQDRAKLLVMGILVVGIVFETLKQVCPSWASYPDILTLASGFGWGGRP